MLIAIAAILATLALAASLLWLVAAGSGRLAAPRRDRLNAFAAEAIAALNGEPVKRDARPREPSRPRD